MNDQKPTTQDGSWLGPASVAGVVVGLALILLAELGHQEWARVFGAALIALGGIGAGLVLGWFQPVRERWLPALRDQRVGLGLLVALILVLPVVVALVAALAGLGSALDDTTSDAAVLGGGLVALLMLAATLGSGWIAIRAIRRAGEPGGESPGEEEA